MKNSADLGECYLPRTSACRILNISYSASLNNCEISFCPLCVIVLSKEARSFIADTFAIEELKIYGWILNAEVVIRKESVVISRCCFAEAGTHFFISIARTASLLLLRPIEFLIYGVVIAVPVVDAKAPPFFFWFCFFVCFCFLFFAEDERDLFISTFRTCSTIIFPHLTNQVIVCALPLPFFLSLLQLPN